MALKRRNADSKHPTRPPRHRVFVEQEGAQERCERFFLASLRGFSRNRRHALSLRSQYILHHLASGWEQFGV